MTLYASSVAPRTMISSLKIRTAGEADIPSIEVLLQTLHLPTAGISSHIRHYLITEAEGVTIGAIGLEIYETTGLLRSAAVKKEFQGLGIGDKLVSLIIAYAKEQRVKELVLLTTTAENYFSAKGFTKIDRTAVRGDVLRSDEFTGACPENAVVMKKVLA